MDKIEESIEEIEVQISDADEKQDEEALSLLYHKRGLILKNQKFEEEALDSFMKSLGYSIKSNNKHLMALNNFNLGLITKEMGRFDNAASFFKEAFGCAKNAGDIQLARKALNNTFEINKERRDSTEEEPIPITKPRFNNSPIGRKFSFIEYFTEGSKEFGNRNYIQAIKILNEVVERNPNIYGAWLLMIDSYLKLDEPEQVLRCSEHAIKLKPKMGYFRGTLAEAYEMLGNKKKAISCYKKAIKVLDKELDKDYNDITLNGIGWFHMKLRNYKESLFYSEEALKLRPESEHHTHNLGLAYLELGELQKAIRFFELALKFDPTHSYSWYDLGRVYEKLNDLEKAFNCFENAVKFDPQWVRNRNKLIELNPNSPFLSLEVPDLSSREEKRKEIKEEVIGKEPPKNMKESLERAIESSENLLKLDKKVELLKPVGLEKIVKKSKNVLKKMLKTFEEKSKEE